MRIKDISELYNRIFRPLCLYALKYTGDYTAAEDIVQDCFIAFLEKTEGDKSGIRNADAYLRTSVRNRCIDFVRKQGIEIPIGEDFDRMDNEYTEVSRLEAQVWKRIEALPHRQRQILLMSKRDGMPYSEIARELHLSEQTVKNQISRAMKKIRHASKIPNLQMVLFLMFPVI